MRKDTFVARWITRCFITVVLSLAPVCPLSAGLIFTLDAPVFFGAPATTFDVTGSLSNPDTVPLFLNTASGSLSSGDLDFDYGNFFVLVPRTLNAGGLYSGPIFSVVVSLQTPPGDYFGSFTPQGGVDGNAFDDLATQNFQITVTGAPDVPEPSTFGLLVIALLILMGSVRRCKGPEYHRNSSEDYLHHKSAAMNNRLMCENAEQTPVC